MAKIITDDQHYIDIATTIREKTDSEETFKPNEMADKVVEVYDKGRHDEWSDFWDKFQNKGAPGNYDYLFYCNFTLNGIGWNDDNFKPKYDIVMTSGDRAFRGCGFTDFNAILERQGVIFDSSRATVMHLCFQNCYNLTRVPTIDVSNCPSGMSNTLFGYCGKLHTIDKLKVRDDGSTQFTEVFYGCNVLKNITFDGVIGRTISFSSSPLSIESMKDVINHLADYSAQNTGTYTLTLRDECKIALEAEGKTSPNGNLWTEYVADLGWNLA